MSGGFEIQVFGWRKGKGEGMEGGRGKGECGDVVGVKSRVCIERLSGLAWVPVRRDVESERVDDVSI